MVKLNSSLKASTLMESLVAMVIIVVSLGVGTMIYSNVLNSDKQVLQLKATCILDQQAAQTKTEKSFLDDEKLLGNWKIKKKVDLYDQTKNLYQLTFSAFDGNGQLIAIRKELIITQ